ncbi:MAG: hypothetical protein ACPLXO_03130 [Desulfurella sp.]
MVTKKIELNTDNNVIRVDQGVFRYLSVALPASQKHEKLDVIVKDKSQNGMGIKTKDGLNINDLFTLFQLIHDHKIHSKEYETTGLIDGKRVLRRKIAISDLCKERNIGTDKRNRKTIAESIYRWYQAEIILVQKDKLIFTRYIFKFEVDKDFSFVDFSINEKFIELCEEHGLIFSFKNLLVYENIQDKKLMHYKNYAIKLHIYLQSQKIKKRKKFYFRSQFSEEELFEASGIKALNLPLKTKRKYLKHALYLLHNFGGLPMYEFDKERQIYKRANYTVLPKNKTR